MTKNKESCSLLQAQFYCWPAVFNRINKINEYSSQYFLDHTIINGVNCSNYDVDGGEGNFDRALEWT